MSRPASLERLRDISKQRSIRWPLLIPVPCDSTADCGRTTEIEWPVPVKERAFNENG